MDAEKRILCYLEFIQEFPHLFVNEPDPHSIHISTDREELLRKQKELYATAMESNEPLSWYDIGIVAEDRWVMVIRDLVVFPGGKYGCYTRVLNKTSVVARSGDDVVVMAMVGDRILLLRHFRHDDRRWHWEIPRGFGERGMSAERNAQKEIKEETGMEVDELILLGGGMTDGSEKITYFLAKCSGRIHLEDEEGIKQCLLVDANKMGEMILNGEIGDRYTMKAFLYAKLRNIL